MDGELHADAHRGNEDDHRNGAQLDSHQPHKAKQLHSHERKHQHLKEEGGACVRKGGNEESNEVMSDECMKVGNYYWLLSSKLICIKLILTLIFYKLVWKHLHLHLGKIHGDTCLLTVLVISVFLSVQVEKELRITQNVNNIH